VPKTSRPTALVPQARAACHASIGVRILSGLLEGIVSENTADVSTVAGWLAGSDVETALETIDQLEEKAERIKKTLSAAKKALAQCFLD
jgi:hypothetical protein